MLLSCSFVGILGKLFAISSISLELRPLDLEEAEWFRVTNTLFHFTICCAKCIPTYSHRNRVLLSAFSGNCLPSLQCLSNYVYSIWRKLDRFHVTNTFHFSICCTKCIPTYPHRNFKV